MATTVRTERHKRGFFGWIFLILFWGFNGLMAYATFAGLSGNAEQMAQLTSDAEKTGYAAGTAIGASFILIIWAAGALILGLFVMFTRGRKVITETTSG